MTIMEDASKVEASTRTQVFFATLFPSTAINGPFKVQWENGMGPTEDNPLSVNDIVIVEAEFGTYNENGTPVAPKNYFGLSIGACVDTSNAIDTMKAELYQQGYLGLLKNITTENSPQASDFFDCAIQYSRNMDRDNQEIANITYKVVMTFNPGSKASAQIKDNNCNIAIVADYGDPHVNSIPIPVRI
ncbi:hypothetical protein [Ferrimonas aestuarii]|uniref:Uncharacterized protein n=1 Tax=Ferrimonas aestuarii TaxID=2569539 RepID=A0A4V5NW50_9GAMM|nr:hypothetical protein [Ferrimonas aestuarii]TKB54944.1 hypothetical protein FCL42_10270 [Ferrimonas aestuarii]